MITANGKKLILGYCLFFGLILFWIVGLGCWPILQWSPLNRRHEDIDISSGKIRRQRELLGICVQESIEDSALSSMLAAETAGEQEKWRRVNTFSPLVHSSPHNRYHTAISQMGYLEMAWKTAPFAEDAKRKTARDLLRIWQFDQGYFPVTKYLSSIDALLKKHQNGPPISVEELPEAEDFREK